MARVNVESEMTGSIWKILAKVGDQAEEGEPLMIIESMKMEIPVLAPESGRVVEILVGEGDMVAEGDPVAVLES